MSFVDGVKNGFTRLSQEIGLMSLARALQEEFMVLSVMIIAFMVVRVLFGLFKFTGVSKKLNRKIDAKEAELAAKVLQLGSIKEKKIQEQQKLTTTKTEIELLQNEYPGLKEFLLAENHKRDVDRKRREIEELKLQLKELEGN